MLGAPIAGPIWCFGNNKAKVEMVSKPASHLKKQHLLLSFHCLCSLCAMILTCHQMDTKSNFVDVCTEACDCATLRNLIGLVLFWKGDQLAPSPSSCTIQAVDCAPGCVECQLQNSW